jgi:hypothetical protein
VLFEAARPTLLNGIEEVISRPDLGDRAIFLTWRPLARRNDVLKASCGASSKSRAPHPRRRARRSSARPAHLGSRSSGSAAAHGRFRDMGDGLRTALWPAGTFARVYGANRRTAIEGMIDADPVAACVRGIMAERSSWTGSAADASESQMGKPERLSKASR